MKLDRLNPHVFDITMSDIKAEWEQGFLLSSDRYWDRGKK